MTTRMMKKTIQTRRSFVWFHSAAADDDDAVDDDG